MGLYKRNKIWWMAITHQGKQVRKSTETSNKRLAEGIMAKVKVRIIEGKRFDNQEAQGRTFAEMMERYMNEQSIKKARCSHQRDQQSLKHLLPYFGGRTLAEMTPKHLSSYKTKRLMEGIAPATLNKELGLIKAAFNVAIREWEWRRDNPVSRVSMEQDNNARVRYLNSYDFERVFEKCPDWVKNIVLVARYTGMRRESIITLRWEQVDLQRKLILLNKTKNGDRIGLSLCKKVIEVLKSLKKVKRTGCELVFSKTDGTPYQGRTVTMAFIRACRRKNISDFRSHDLRHTFASCLV